MKTIMIAVSAALTLLTAPVASYANNETTLTGALVGAAAGVMAAHYGHISEAVAIPVGALTGGLLANAAERSRYDYGYRSYGYNDPRGDRAYAAEHRRNDYGYQGYGYNDSHGDRAYAAEHRRNDYGYQGYGYNDSHGDRAYAAEHRRNDYAYHGYGYNDPQFDRRWYDRYPPRVVVVKEVKTLKLPPPPDLQPGVDLIKVSVPFSSGIAVDVPILRIGDKFIGPQGEEYSSLPTAKALAEKYAK